MKLRDLVRRHVEHPGRGGCGVGAITDLDGVASHELIEQSLAALRCLEHRGGVIGDTGDGAGLLFRTDREFFSRFIAPGRRLPDEHALVVGVLFFPRGEESNLPHWQHEIDAITRRHGLAPLGWRHVPVEDSALGVQARESRRDVWQLLLGEGMVPREDLRRTLFRVKGVLESRIHDLYIASLSPRTLVYKALATGDQLQRFYPDLSDPRLKTSTIVFHRRYSTNTFSNWTLAQVFRVLGHNGEINTIKANRNAVASMEVELGLHSVLMPQGSDSADMDRVVELFTTHGVSLPETLARIMPMAWRDLARPAPEIGRFYRGVQRAMGSLGAWEGPAAIVATDGRWLVGGLDRMGLRPLRWTITKSRRLVLASEAGAVPIPFEDVAEVGQLDPGEIIGVDLDAKQVYRPAEILAKIVAETPINFGDLSEKRLQVLARRDSEPQPAAARDHLALNVFGWTWDRAKSARHMAENAKEPITSMGNDRPLAVLSHLRPPVTKYFKQIVAVVTNPPIDPIREEGAFDLTVHLGASPTISESRTVYEPQPGYRLPSPIVTEEQLWLMCENKDADHPRAKVFDATFTDPRESSVHGAKAIARRISEISREAVEALKSEEASILVLTDRDAARAESKRLPLPMVLVTSAVHNALVESGLRRRGSIIVDTGEIQEGHDAAVFVANGATAVCPWLFYRVGAESGPTKNMVVALEEMLRRVMSKMGICSADGYRGSRLFEAVGLAPGVVDHYLPGIASRLGGLELDDLYDDLRARRALGDTPQRESEIGVYRKAVWSELQITARGHDPESYARFLKLVGSTPPVYLRDLLQLRVSDTPLPVDRVAPEETIIAACIRGAAMSHGALHRVAHRAIAAAFNEFGSSSNCGEGGEDARRDKGGPWEESRSRIRQVASGRFGVEARFLAYADEMQIKIGQGAKPGEGGMLPAAKVTAEIAMIRRTQVGVTLISPPPHHNIYSIEDLAQLIYDFRQVNPRATVSVKIPAVTDIGTIAVGIAKAGADVIDIAGFEGGTGAASSSSIEHAGLPLERGLSEVHQALVIHGIRGRVRLRADGGIKTGFDVAAVLALGADEISLGTALMIAEQCIFCHGCANGFCPAGITTQSDLISRRLMTIKKGRSPDEELRDAEDERYLDAKNGVKRYLMALAGDLRGKLASLGLTHPSQLVGRADLLERKPESSLPAGEDTVPGRAAKVDLSEIVAIPDGPHGKGRVLPRLPLDVTSEFNARLVRAAADGGALSFAITNTDRAAGATLAGRISLRELTPPEAGFRIVLVGYAGQALGFACVEGMHITLEGFANDSVAEAMSGGTIAIRPPASLAGESLSLCGNAAAYGATGGSLFIAGRAGQRCGVRNSGAIVVVEGAGKYAFEYMTGGVGVILGLAGPVIGSGMTGGVVYAAADPLLAEKLAADAKIVPMTGDDRPRLAQILAAYAAATGSTRRAESFVKIVPR